MPKIVMPKLSDTMLDGTLVSWNKQQGDRVEIGDILASIETDKATMEMESFDEGILSEIYVNAGDKVIVGYPIAYIRGENEKEIDTSQILKNKVVQSCSQDNLHTDYKNLFHPAKSISNRPLPPRLNSSNNSSIRSNMLSHKRYKVTPLARKLALESDISLHIITGTGPGGRIISDDIRVAISKKKTDFLQKNNLITPVFPVTIEGLTEKVVPLTSMRKTIADRLSSSKQNIPHFYLSIEIDATEMIVFREEINTSKIFGETKITFNDIILIAIARATSDHPDINVAFSPDGIIEYQNVNIAVAISVDAGLVTPVIWNANLLSLSQISSKMKQLAIVARNKKLKPEDYIGGTLTVSNLGAHGIESFSAIINPPQAVILAIASIVKKPIISKQDKVTIGHRMNITLSGDHRAIDGVMAARYLASIRSYLEHPSLLLL